ncbi:MAG: PEP-CTERM system histidine kinase PrsK [Verrucomicrobia bacterium]|nr:PEP-CTERM system histidine kinase PrsK [Verrucomicrobiota bacterium]
MSTLLSPASLCFASAAATIVVAIFGSLRLRRGTADWTLVLGLCLFAADRILAAFSLQAATLGDVEAIQQWRVIVLSALPGVWLVFSLTFARVNAANFLRRWKFIWPAALVVPLVLAIAFRQDLFSALYASRSEPWILRLGWPATVVYCILLPVSVLVLMNLERTYRASVGTLRWRIKFMLLGVGVVFVTEVYSTSQAVLYRSITASMESTTAIAVLLAMVIVGRYLLRNSQFDTEVYPSQSVLEGSVIVVLAAIYLLGVGVLAKLVTYFGGDAAFELKAFVLLMSLVLLGVLFQSDRVRLYLRRMVSRHFQRPIYDYQAIWRKFSEGTASAVDPTDLCRAVVNLTAEVFEALSVTIWIANDSRDTLTVAASTSLSTEKASVCTPTEAEIRAVFAHFEANPHPVDIETGDAPWAVALRRWHPIEFPERGSHRMCAPFVRQGRIGGILMIGDRVSGVEFPDQDMDMLKCVTDHVTTRLMNVQLAQRLVQAKELAAFQAMATFFVHDLKNAASTLNLMLQNLPVHFNDPAFREDALRGMGKTVEHMNRLIGRLGQLRHDLNLRLTPGDLNTVVEGVLRGLQNATGVRISREFAPLPAAAIDPEQLQKVITNLLLNAIEATPPQGEIRLATRATATEVVFSVADTGCGMSAEFIQRSLFRPFQTTKKTGMGIGMFQSKMIVEAHGGRLTVTSAPNQGTTFQVHLPTHGK